MSRKSTDDSPKLHFSSSSGEQFHGFFNTPTDLGFRKKDLMDARARRLFDSTALACHHDAYPFQIPLQGKSGPCVQADGHSLLMLSSYDYLGLIGDPRVDHAAVEAVKKYGTGTGGVRLLTGTIDLHRQMEEEFAEFRGTDESITFSSGYLANLAVISSLFGPADRVIADAIAHRSLIDACRLAGVQMQRFRHNDMSSLREELEAPTDANRTLVVVDGVFSMEGDICRLPEILELRRRYGFFLLVDESHALGVLGEGGRGTNEHFGIPASEIDIWTGSLAKGIPSNGGFVAVSQELAIFLQHASSPFIFSAALCPAAVAAVRESISILKREPERVTRMQENAEFLRGGLISLGYDTGLSETAVIPVIFQDDRKTALFARKLRDYGILATPVLFPAVPAGSARLRLCVTAAHTREQLSFALDVFAKLRND
jgi:8-amino-7-oxononanoate synthase